MTNKRVGFVKAIMKSGIISGIAKKLGAKPVFSFELSAIKSIERDTSRKIPRLVISDGARTEEFWVVEAGMDKLIAALKPGE